MIATRTIRFRLRNPDDPALSLMPSDIVPDEITGLSRARHLPKLVRQ